MKKFDLVTIGGGSGGIAAANRAAEYGAKVAVIEKDYLGGTCVNRGCVPKKVSWYASRVNAAIQQYGPGYGFKAENVSFDFSEFLKARDGYVERSRAGYTSRFEKNKIELFEGHARLVSDHEIEVNGEIIYAEHIILATGGRPKMPNVKGIELTDSSDDFFNWTTLPTSVAVVGAGYIAVELAGVLDGLGVETHLVVRHDRPLRKFDSMLSDALMEAMEKNGPILIKQTSFDEYREEEGKIACYQNGEKHLVVDRVIMAVGRQANTENIGLETVEVETDKDGFVIVNESHQTASPTIYAIGDMIGKIDLTPVAIRAGRQISEFLFNQAKTSAIDYTNVPTVVFSHPAIGTIGYTEEDAVETFGADDIKVYRNKFFSMYASAAWHREPCYFKLICQGPEETVIGLHGIGEGVDEMIQGFGVAIKMGATKEQFDSVIAIHPTGAEEFVTMR